MPLTGPTIITADGKSKDFTFKGKYPTLEEMQQAVGGYIQMIHLTPRLVMIMNEEGKLEGLPVNDRATEIASGIISPADYIVGDVIIMERKEMEKEEDHEA